MIQRALQAFFAKSRNNTLLSGYKSSVYLTHLTNIFVAARQLADYGAIIFRSPRHTIPASIRAFSGNPKFSVKELRAENYMNEMADVRALQKWVDEGAKIGLFKYTNDRMFEVYTDAVISEYQSRVRNPKELMPGSETMDRLKEFFGNDTAEVIAALKVKPWKTAKESPLLLKLARNELANKQPILRSSQSLALLESQWGRTLGTLRTFAMQDIRYFYRETMKDFGKHPARSMKNLLMLTATMTIAKASVDMLSDLMKGRRPNFTQSVIDEWLSFIFLSRYGIDIIRGQGPIVGVWRGLMPAAGHIDTPARATMKYLEAHTENDFEANKDYEAAARLAKETVRYIPVVGAPYYWWFGEGRRKELEKQAKALKDRPL